MTSRIVVALAVCLAGSIASAQSTVRVSLDDARVLATRALLAGEPAAAIQLAEGLLEADPDDRTALLIIAAAAPQLGDPTRGRKAGARAYDLSTTDVDRYEAARLTALAAANEERFTLATLWLRRALTVAPSDADAAQTRADAAAVRRQNPFTTNLSLSVVPSNNVNGGTDELIGSDGGVFSQSARALAGVRTTFDFRTSYRLQESIRNRTVAGLRYQQSWVSLRDEGEPDALDVDGNPVTFLRNEDFANAYAEVSLAYDHALERGTVGATLATGLFENGGEPYYDFAKITLDRAVPLSDAAALGLAVTWEEQDYASDGIGEVQKGTVRGSLTHRLASGDQVRFDLAYTDSMGDSINNTYGDWSIGGYYAWAEPFGPITLGLGGGLRWTDYPDYVIGFSPVEGGREDLTAFYNFDVGFPQIEYAGFTPAIGVSGSIADSNVTRFTRDTLSIGLKINSSF